MNDEMHSTEPGDAERWQEGNDEYLTKALAWLRLRLEQQIGEVAEVPGSDAWAMFRRRKKEEDSVEPPPKIDSAQVEGVAKAMADAEAHEPPPAMVLLARRLGLSPFEQRVLLLAAAMELDTRIAGMCARAQGDPSRPHPTFALALTLFDEAAWDAMSPERPLRYWRLLEINQPGAQPLTTSALRADERIVSYLKGLNYLDDRLTPLLVPLDPEAGAKGDLPPSQRAVVDKIDHHLRSGANGGRPLVVQLLGPDGASKQLVAAHSAAGLGLELFRLPAVLLPAESSELETLARLWQRESLLLPVALYLDAAELDESATDKQPLPRFLTRTRTLVFLATRDMRPGLERTSLVVDVAKPTPAEQQQIWQEALAPESTASPPSLAGQFNLSSATIRRIVRLAAEDPPDDGEPSDLRERLWDACLMHTRPQLDVLAQRIDVKATWDDIVLPEEQRSLLQQIADQVAQRSRVYDDWGFRRRMNRGLGITALFAGESGTGKTMAAEVLAQHLRLNLYRIDLSGVVSKYIGETEKNLRRLFDAAEDGGAILFFDEADALFGKRSEVKDSHDRYANIEINYLLQRMEAYRGLAILATNMKSALDKAFVRRLRFMLDFPFPGEADRKAIWQRAFPPEVPLNGLDWDRLARLNLTGGSIHNVALNSAFRAAHQESEVTMPLVLDTARAEMKKMDRPVHEAMFRWCERSEEGVA